MMEELQRLVYLLRESSDAIAQAMEDAADSIEKTIKAQQAGACVHKTEDGRCGDPELPITFCIGAACPDAKISGGKAPKTNGDRLRAMTDEQMAKKIPGFVVFCAPGHRPSPDCCGNCRRCWLEWLQRPAEVP